MFILGYFGINYQKDQKEKQTINETISQPATIENNDNTSASNKENPKKKPEVNKPNINSTDNTSQQVTVVEQQQEPINKVAPNIEIVTEQQPQISDCEKNNTGDYCFTNTTSVNIKIHICPITEDFYTAKKLGISLAPGETKCFYNLVSGVYKYKANGRFSSLESSSSGQIKLEKCKSETLAVNIIPR